MRFFGSRCGRGVAVALTCLALAGCGGASRPPAASQKGMAPGPSYAVSIPIPPPAPKPIAPADLQSVVTMIGRQFQGRVGIAVRGVDQGWAVSWNGDLRLPQQSVSKFWVALTVLDARDQGKLKLDDPVVVTQNDLTLFHQPIAGLVKGDGFHTTVEDLMVRALTHSDNTANDKLLWLVGGPSAVRDFIARKNLGNVRFGPGERMLQAETAGLVWQPSYAQNNGFMIARSQLSPEVRTAALDAYVANPPDGAAPLAITAALGKLARGELLSETSTRFLLDTMGNTVTGRARMRAAIPPGWTIQHKTGTGQDLGRRNAGFNDIGILTAPDGTRYAVAVMIGDTEQSETLRQQLIQSVARAVVFYQAQHGGPGSAGMVPTMTAR